ncbi:MAG: DUF4397 domain-containing protein [Gemmatimonadaceae bacterium]
MKKTISLAVLLCAAVLSSCGDEGVQTIAGPTSGARIKFFNFGVGAPGVYFYANDTKMTAIGPTGATTSAKGVSTGGTESVTGTVYGGVGAGGYYTAIAPGPYTLKAKIAATVDKDLVVATLATTLTDGKAYSFYMSGIYDATAKTVESFVVEDAYPAAFDYTKAYVRFVNAVSNSNPMALYATDQTTLAEVPVGAIVAYKGGGAFTAVPNGVYNLGAREAGATTNKMSRTGVSFSAGRVYTIAARGNITVTSTQALDNTINR